MFGYSVEFDRSVFDRVDSNLRVMPRLLQTALKRRETALRRMVLDIVAVPGKPRTGNVIWASDLQQKAYFATDGFGKGIPYPPTGDLVAGWRAEFEFSEDGGAFAVWNIMPYAPFVVGEDQQPMHIGRWVNAPRALDEFAPVVLNDVEQTLITVGDPLAGVPR